MKVTQLASNKQPTPNKQQRTKGRYSLAVEVRGLDLEVLKFEGRLEALVL